MATLKGRLGELQAQDVMTKSVITLRERDTLSNAVRRLKSHHITGAPVIDAAGKLVGILSISDLCDLPGGTSKPSRERVTPLAHGEDSTTWDLFDRAGSFTEEDADQTVASRMSTDVTSVTADAPLVEVARAMCDGHWHRVPVIDENGSLKGIVSTMDVLAAVVNVADETHRK